MSAALRLVELDREEIDRRLETLFSFDHGPEYPYEHPPGDARPIDGPLPAALEEFHGGSQP